MDILAMQALVEILDLMNAREFELRRYLSEQDILKQELR